MLSGFPQRPCPADVIWISTKTMSSRCYLDFHKDHVQQMLSGFPQRPCPADVYMGFDKKNRSSRCFLDFHKEHDQNSCTVFCDPSHIIIICYIFQAVWLVTFVAVVVLDVALGLLIGIVFSLYFVLRHSQK